MDQNQQQDIIYTVYDKGLYRITGEESSNEVMDMLQSDPGASSNTGSVTIASDSVDSGYSASSSMQASGIASSQGKKDYDNTIAGYILGIDPADGFAKFYIGDPTNYLNWTGTGLVITGSVTATTGTIGGWTISASSLSSVSGGNTTTLSSGVTSFSSGPTGSPTTTITQAGLLSCTGAIIDGTSLIGGRFGSVLATAINSTGNFIDANLDTSTKNILASFSFGISGAIQIGTYVDGVTGDIKISPNGIVGRDSTGANSFTIDGTTGSATFAGALSAATGTLGSITAGTFTGVTISIGTGNSIFKADANGIYLGNAVFASAPFSVTPAGALSATSATITGALTTSGGSSIDGQYLSTGSVTSAAANLALRGWIQTSVFTVTDLDTVAWGTGTLTASDGTAYSISAGNTGNMAAKSYVYLDIAVSVTAYQVTTTAATAVGNGKILVAICQNGATEATFMLLNNNSYNIDAANIVAGSITANEISTATITADRMNVSTLSAISANLGSITAGSLTINSGAASIDSSGNAVFKSVQIGGSTIQYQINNSGIFSFGDGSDGSHTTSGDETLTSDKYYTDLTIANGHTINPGGFRIFCSGTLTESGTGKIARNGNNGGNGGNGNTPDTLGNGRTGGTAGTAGAALSDGYLKGSLIGGAGGGGGNGGPSGAMTGTTGTSGGSTSNSIGLSGTNGGDGGGNACGGGGADTHGPAGSGGTATASNVKLIANWHLSTLLDVSSSGSTVKFDNSAAAGGGGGGGGGDQFIAGAFGGGGGAGGGAGSAGGIVAIYARNIVIGASASITANGGNGGTGGNGGNGNGTGGQSKGGGGGGGGAGGNGGQIILVYNTISNAGSVAASGGTHGNGGSGGTGFLGGPVINGCPGANGTDGQAGTIRQFQLSL